MIDTIAIQHVVELENWTEVRVDETVSDTGTVEVWGIDEDGVDRSVTVCVHTQTICL